MKPTKLNIKTLGSINDNNHLTERVLLNNGSTSTIKESIRDIGVVKRSVDYKIKKSGPKITYYLTFTDNTFVEVHRKVWEVFDMLPVNIQESKRK